MIYDIEKIKGSSKYVVCHTDTREIIPGFAGDKKKAMKKAAELNGVDTKTFMKERRAG